MVTDKHSDKHSDIDAGQESFITFKSSSDCRKVSQHPTPASVLPEPEPELESEFESEMLSLDIHVDVVVDERCDERDE